MKKADLEQKVAELEAELLRTQDAYVTEMNLRQRREAAFERYSRKMRESVIQAVNRYGPNW